MSNYEDAYHKPTNKNLKDYSKRFIDHMFNMMQNPKFRGEKFTWEEFPEMMAGFVEANIFTTYKCGKSDEKKAMQYARQYANKLIKTLK